MNQEGKKSICKDYLTLFVPQIPVNPIYLISPLCDADAVKKILKLVGFVGFNNNFWFVFLFFSVRKAQQSRRCRLGCRKEKLGSESKQFKTNLITSETRMLMEICFSLRLNPNRMETGMSSEFMRRNISDYG